ncbi:lipase family protein [Anabaena azotica]|uniref:lipase family protein n=1 Tax=Anabaena azotica TaxID=197653 RepID=UPI0039A48A0F
MYFPPEFNLDLAKELGNLVAQAYTQYEDYTKQEEWKLDEPYSLKSQFYYTEDKKILCFTYKKNTVPFGFTATKGNNFYIVFRGTETPLEWLRDAQLKQVDYLKGWGKTTRGFSQIYRAIAPTILNDLKNVSRSTKIYVTGHSLGSALANLCVPDVITNFPDIQPELYTFASPRTGNIIFAQAYRLAKIKAWRIANTEDLVTNIPFATLEITDSNIKDVQRKLNLLRIILGGIEADLLEEFEHIGGNIAFTINKGSLTDNHAMTTYLNAITSND